MGAMLHIKLRRTVDESSKNALQAHGTAWLLLTRGLCVPSVGLLCDLGRVHIYASELHWAVVNALCSCDAVICSYLCREQA